jgi:serine protease SohB
LKEELEDVHALFKGAVSKYRPDLDLEKIATGEHWYGTRAIELGLVDEIKTSDELLAELARDRDLYRVAYKMKMPLQRRLLSSVDNALERVDNLYWRRHFETRLPR